MLAEKGNTLEIDHGNGLVSGYFHIEHEQVRPGDKVAAGQNIGLPGCCPDGWGVNGCWSTAPHLHFYTTYGGFRQSIVGLNLGGWRVQEDGCLTRADQVSCPLKWTHQWTHRVELATPGSDLAFDARRPGGDH